jgi:hypothetical protein
MTARAVVTLRSPIRSQSPERERIKAWVNNVPPGTRIEFRAPVRSVDQNARMWAMLADIKRQCERFKNFDADDLKVVFMHAWRKEIRVLPSLDGASLIPVYRSSELSKSEMCDLQEFISAWAAENGIEILD